MRPNPEENPQDGKKTKNARKESDIQWLKKEKVPRKKGKIIRLRHNFDLIYTSLSYFLMAESFCHGINFIFSDRRLGKHLV